MTASKTRRSLLGLTLLLLTSTAIAQQHALPDPASGTPDTLIAPANRKPAPDFTLTDLDGKVITLSKLHGKVVLLDFWATWCGGCKLELPWYVDFDHKYRAQGLAVVGVSMDDGGAQMVRTFATQKSISYPIVIGNEVLGDKFHLESMPLSLLIDKQGRIAVVHAGVVQRATFEQHLQNLLH